MDKDRIIELLNKRISGTITLPEQSELYMLLKQNPGLQQLHDDLDVFSNEKAQYDSDAYSQSMDRVFGKLSARISSKNSEQPIKKSKKIAGFEILKIAASVLIVIGIAAFWVISNKDKFSNNIDTKIEAVTAKGSKSYIVLPDGSRVWINADSKVTYDKEFGKNTRDVTLTGEAYFDVVKDKSKPFIVHTKTIDVKVLGTAFNVRAYGDEPNSEATLVRGKVEVFLKKHNGQTILLDPNEKVIVKNTLHEAKVHGKVEDAKLSEVAFTKIDLNPVDSTVYETGWVNNKLVFRQDKFEDIIPVLERWYNVKITVKRAPKGKGFSGTFENDSLEDVLQSLMLSAGINYKIEKDKVVIF